MYLQYGSFTHANSECGLSVRRDALVNEGGQIYALKERWDISGFLQAATQAALSTAMQAIEDAYKIQGESIGLYFAGGAPSWHQIDKAKTLGGTVVVQRPTFAKWEGAEYTTYRSYTIAVEAELPLASDVLLSFHETLTFEGDGGPRFGYLEALTGPPQKQLLAEASVMKATQTGRSVGYLAEPPVMLPLFPDAVHRERSRVWADSPERRGPIGTPSYTKFAVNWHYEMEGLGLDRNARPNRWI